MWLHSQMHIVLHEVSITFLFFTTVLFDALLLIIDSLLVNHEPDLRQPAVVPTLVRQISDVILIIAL